MSVQEQLLDYRLQREQLHYRRVYLHEQKRPIIEVVR
jgi:hypothetical protein